MLNYSPTLNELKYKDSEKSIKEQPISIIQSEKANESEISSDFNRATVSEFSFEVEVNDEFNSHIEESKLDGDAYLETLPDTDIKDLDFLKSSQNPSKQSRFK
jgi:hypothetical protein